MRTFSRGFTFFLLLACSTLVLATGPHKPAPAPAPKPAPPSVTVAPVTNSKSDSSSTSESVSDSKSDSNSVLNAEYRERLQAPAITAPPVYASGPCAYGWSAGISVPGAGVSGGKSKADPSCDRRELVRVITPLNPYLALKVACEDPIIVEMRLRNLASVSDCTYAPPAVAVPPAPVAAVVAQPTVPKPPELTVTRTEVQEMVDKAFKKTMRK